MYSIIIFCFMSGSMTSKEPTIGKCATMNSKHLDFQIQVPKPNRYCRSSSSVVTGSWFYNNNIFSKMLVLTFIKKIKANMKNL